MKRTAVTKNIYKSGNSHNIAKSINNKVVHFKTLRSLGEAVEYRDRLIANDWKPLPETPEERLEKDKTEYFKRIHRNRNRTGYVVRNDKDEYLTYAETIEEALYYRDLYRGYDKGTSPRYKDTDLKTDNPYLKDGLKYPLPERLILPPKKNDGYGTGSIVKKGETSFHLYHGKKGNGYNSYVCACPTIEMAEYVRTEMNKCNWNMDELDRIIDDYPKYYTWLLFFYQYIHINRYDESKYDILIPREYLPEGKDIELFTGYGNIEDALYERDFLMEHNWDYDLLVESIDDSKNPYYDMDLPRYPTRKIRNITRRKYYEKELTRMHELLQENEDITLREISEALNVTEPTIRNWLKKSWNTDYKEFRQISLNGENPIHVLEKQEQIIQPDLSTSLPSNYKGYVHHMKNGRFQVRKGQVTYGLYPTEELARKIVKDLRKCNWDKGQLKAIQAKHGHTSMRGSKRWVYRNGKGWAVRRKGKNKRMVTYGTFRDKRIACLCRDMLLEHGFSLENMDWIEPLATTAIQMTDMWPSTMFGRATLEDIEYIESSTNISCITQTRQGTWRVDKTVNGKRTYYGTYKTRDKAMNIYEFLEDNNWDKELLNMMKEMGEI